MIFVQGCSTEEPAMPPSDNTSEEPTTPPSDNDPEEPDTPQKIEMTRLKSVSTVYESGATYLSSFEYFESPQFIELKGKYRNSSKEDYTDYTTVKIYLSPTVVFTNDRPRDYLNSDGLFVYTPDLGDDLKNYHFGDETSHYTYNTQQQLIKFFFPDNNWIYYIEFIWKNNLINEFKYVCDMGKYGGSTSYTIEYSDIDNIGGFFPYAYSLWIAYLNSCIFNHSDDNLSPYLTMTPIFGMAPSKLPARIYQEGKLYYEIVYKLTNDQKIEKEYIYGISSSGEKSLESTTTYIYETYEIENP